MFTSLLVPLSLGLQDTGWDLFLADMWMARVKAEEEDGSQDRDSGGAEPVLNILILLSEGNSLARFNFQILWGDSTYPEQPVRVVIQSPG